MNKISLKELNDPKSSIEQYSNNMQDVYKNIEEYNSSRKCIVLIADVISNEKINQVVTEIFIRRRKLNISPAFFTEIYF